MVRSGIAMAAPWPRYRWVGKASTNGSSATELPSGTSSSREKTPISLGGSDRPSGTPRRQAEACGPRARDQVLLRSRRPPPRRRLRPVVCAIRPIPTTAFPLCLPSSTAPTSSGGSASTIARVTPMGLTPTRMDGDARAMAEELRGGRPGRGAFYGTFFLAPGKTLTTVGPARSRRVLHADTLCASAIPERRPRRERRDNRHFRAV